MITTTHVHVSNVLHDNKSNCNNFSHMTTCVQKNIISLCVSLLWVILIHHYQCGFEIVPQNFYSLAVFQNAVADPGFPVGGACTR